MPGAVCLRPFWPAGMGVVVAGKRTNDLMRRGQVALRRGVGLSAYPTQSGDEALAALLNGDLRTLSARSYRLC
jgi:hypothetical protein